MRDEKRLMYNELRSRAEDSVYFILTDFSGLTVEKDQALRGKLRDVSAEFHVVKNNLFRSVTKDLGMEQMQEHLQGQTAIVHGDGELTEVLKVIEAFVKENELPVVKVGALNGVFLTAKDLETIAHLPSREELLAKMVGSMAAPMSNMVGVLSQLVGGLVHVLKAIENQKQQAA